MLQLVQLGCTSDCSQWLPAMRAGICDDPNTCLSWARTTVCCLQACTRLVSGGLPDTLTGLRLATGEQLLGALCDHQLPSCKLLQTVAAQAVPAGFCCWDAGQVETAYVEALQAAVTDHHALFRLPQATLQAYCVRVNGTAGAMRER